jgi:hypothetical protein
MGNGSQEQRAGKGGRRKVLSAIYSPSSKDTGSIFDLTLADLMRASGGLLWGGRGSHARGRGSAASASAFGQTGSRARARPLVRATFGSFWQFFADHAGHEYSKRVNSLPAGRICVLLKACSTPLTSLQMHLNTPCSTVLVFFACQRALTTVI